MNKVIVSGNLTRKPELRRAKDNLAVARMGIAVNRFAKDEVDFFNVTAFGKTAEFCEKYFDKGRRILIEGRLRTINYTDKDNNKRTATEIIAENVEFADSKHKDNNDTPPEDDTQDNGEDVDLPF